MLHSIDSSSILSTLLKARQSYWVVMPKEQVWFGRDRPEAIVPMPECVFPSTFERMEANF
jgi:hypothetical protein